VSVAKIFAHFYVWDNSYNIAVV